MPEFFLELFSEEIPARMQAQAAAELHFRCADTLALLQPRHQRSWYGPRRIAYSATVNDVASASKGNSLVARGPRLGASERALEGFLNKHGAVLSDLDEANGYYILRKEHKPDPAIKIIAESLPTHLEKFSWPKSMRWGQGGDFTWVRPLRRVICLLDDEVVPVTLGPVTASNQAEGHRFMAPDSFTVTGAAQWETELERHFVIASADRRRQIILDGLHALAAEKKLSLAEDEALLNEVTGLVEFPTSLIGRIDPRFMELPAEVRELSMKVNQRYFALRDQVNKPAPFFAFVANIEAEDGGAAIIVGNERVLRARLADAEHFWNQDHKHSLATYRENLKRVTFHAKLGTQYERTVRIAQLARHIVDAIQFFHGDPETAEVNAQQAQTAGELCKADLTTGMVGEFSELQGIMGGYYADNPAVGAAIRTHYQPKGPNDEVPHGIVACAVALADKLDMLAGFFAIGEQPSGSGDPYALRRAALGVIRIIAENKLRLELSYALKPAVKAYDSQAKILDANIAPKIIDFFADRLRVYLRDRGKRYDVLAATFAANAIDDINILLLVSNSLTEFLATKDGANLLAAYRRAVNILRIENAKDGPHTGVPDRALAAADEERSLMRALDQVSQAVGDRLEAESFSEALHDLATLRAPVDAFFEAVKINADDPELRKNRLRLLAKLRDLMHQIADFSKIEG